MKSTNIIFELIRLARPIHWTKNAAIFAALIFGGMLYDRELFLRILMAFFAFNLAASATYVFNDIIDVDKDRKHPIKKNRPIAKGSIPVPVALVYSASLGIGALGLAFSLSPIFFWVIIGYTALQVAYSLFLKNLHIIDILTIASGFVIRVYAGALVIDAHLSVWFLLCVISAALFLASGKRRAELSIVDAPGQTRKTLTKYSKELLNSYVTMFGNAAWMSWALFTFYQPYEPNENIWLFLAELSRTTTISKLLMITVPVTIFGIMRYQNLIFSGRAEAPEKLLLTDKSLVISVITWVFLVIIILYGRFSFL